MADLTIARVLGGLLAAQTGVMQGQQMGREQRMVEEERKRRAKLQGQGQQFQLLSRLAGLEQQGFDREAEGMKALLPFADEETQPALAQQYSGMLGRTGPATQNALQFMQGQLQPGGAPRPAGTSVAFPPQTGPMPSPATTTAVPFKPRDLKAERARGSIAKRIADARAQAQQVDAALADEYGRLETAYTAKKIGDPEAEAALAALAPRADTKFQLQEKSRREREDTDRTLAEATLAQRKAELESVQSQRDAQKEQKAATEARLMGQSLLRPYAVALKSGKPKLVLKFGSRYGAHLSKNRQYFPEGVPDDLDPTPRESVRMGPDPKATAEQKWAAAEGTGQPIAEVEIIETETPDQIAVRQLAAARQEAGLSPAARLEITRGMLQRLWATVMNKNVSDESRAEAFEVVSALQKENPALEGLFPKTLPKLDRVSPDLKHRIEREAILDARYKEENERKRKRFDLAIEKDRATLAKTRQQVTRDATKYTDAQKQAFKALGDDYDAALKTLDALNKVPSVFRDESHAAQVQAAQQAKQEARQALDAAVATGDSVGPISETVAKRNALTTIDRARAALQSPSIQARRREAGLPPTELTEAEVNALSRASRGR